MAKHTKLLFVYIIQYSQHFTMIFLSSSLSLRLILVLLMTEVNQVSARRHESRTNHHHHRSSSRSGSNRRLEPYASSSRSKGLQLPVDVRLRMPAEFEPVASVVLSAVDFVQNATHEIANILLDSTQVDVFMVGGQESQNQRIYGDLQDSFDTRFVFLPFHVDSAWTRDYGPMGVLVSNDLDVIESMAILDSMYMSTRPSDDDLPCHLSDTFQDWACYEMDLYFEGGNLMSDGQGTIFTTTRVYDWNPDLESDEVDDKLKRYFGAHTIHALEIARWEDGFPMDGTGHIDMFAKLLNTCTVIVAETESPGFQEITNAAAAFFRSLSCGNPDEGKYYRVHRVPAWTAYDETTDQDVYYTYTNSLIVNDVILVPSFRSGIESGTEVQALLAYKEASPYRSVASVPMDDEIIFAGAIHCMTHQLPVASNSPSRTGLHIPNITCIAVAEASCDVSASRNLYCQEQYSRFLHAPTEEQCTFNSYFVENMCCSDVSERKAVFLESSQEDEEEFVNLNITVRLDEHPEDTAWFILDSDHNVVVSSPYYGSDYADTDLTVTFGLRADRMYTFFFMDGNGDGITGDPEQWLTDVGTENAIATVGAFDLLWTSQFEVFPRQQDELPLAEDQEMTENIQRSITSSSGDEDATRRLRRRRD